jgi:Undecaprenyl-phosphate galactose phosphotransferase WbaP
MGRKVGGTIIREKAQLASATARNSAKHAPKVLRPSTLARFTVPLFLIAVDVLMIVVSMLVAIFIRSAIFPGLLGLDPFSPVRNYLSLWPALVLLLLARAGFGLYPGYGLHPAEELKRQTISTASLLFVVLAGGALFQFSADYSRLVLSATGLLLLVGLPLGRALAKGSLSRSRLYGEPIWIVGTSSRAHQLSRVVAANPWMGLRVAGSSAGVPLESQEAKLCLVVPDGLDSLPLAELLDKLNDHFDRVWLAPNLLDIASVWVAPRDLQGHLALELRNNLLEPRNRLLKRLTDIALCLLSLPITLPAMLAIAIWIRASGPGPVLISQERVGKDGRTFRILKFRTMHSDAARLLDELLATDEAARSEWEATRKLRNDPRVTGPGRFLRRSSLDELPQVFNVLVGQMSLVGPRPVMGDEIERYGSSAHLYTKVAPGLTGLTQVSGRSELPYDERVRLDTYYVRNWSIWLDLVILGRTLSAVVAGRGAF